MLCDSDPLKLHYSWCLARVGAASPDRFEQQLERARAAFEGERLGLADLVLVSIPPPTSSPSAEPGTPPDAAALSRSTRRSPSRCGSGTAPSTRSSRDASRGPSRPTSRRHGRPDGDTAALPTVLDDVVARLPGRPHTR
ncbi:MAG TPA: hypothetical protein VGH76_14320 [Actinomycetospora sp.]|uniref:hypothetical protein n=1 Tax=Actinomycetospora sp. TaxID=1872135 RepID=UPI002F3FFBD1